MSKMTYIEKMKKKLGRTSIVDIKPAGGVLRDLRLRKKLSMNEAGRLIGLASIKKRPFTSTYISQIENHRINPPIGIFLAPFLKIYGDITEKYFYELCRQWDENFSDDDLIIMALPKLNEADKKYIRNWIEDKLLKKF